MYDQTDADNNYLLHIDGHMYPFVQNTNNFRYVFIYYFRVFCITVFVQIRFILDLVFLYVKQISV